MVFFGGRLSLRSLPEILIALVALYEFCIVLRVLLGWIRYFAKMEEGRFSYVLYRITEPVLYPVRRTIHPLTNVIGVDLSPAAAILLCEILQYLMRLIFRA